jgi:hypothetical protein
MRYAKWDVARLILSPKNDDLSLFKNWRGICEGMDENSDFRTNRGTIDGLFTTSMGLQKHK